MAITSTGAPLDSRQRGNHPGAPAIAELEHAVLKTSPGAHCVDVRQRWCLTEQQVKLANSIAKAISALAPEAATAEDDVVDLARNLLAHCTG